MQRAFILADTAPVGPKAEAGSMHHPVAAIPSVSHVDEQERSLWKATALCPSPVAGFVRTRAVHRRHTVPSTS
ncbi:MAG: hypothetical protein D6741_11185 [Planctomycetota bacterium]|nr:MAG: hypothetical protein D6741_11185 [Planctomycetota bacterium]